MLRRAVRPRARRPQRVHEQRERVVDVVALVGVRGREVEVADLPRGDGVGEARGGAEVVLEDLEAAVGAADDVEPGDRDPCGRGREVEDGAVEVVARVEHALGEDALGDDLAVAVGVLRRSGRGP